MKNKWQQLNVSDQFEVTNGSTNTDDAIVGGQFPLFDRSVTIKSSDKFLFDTEAVIIPGEGKEFIPRYYEGKFDLHQRAYAIFPKSSAKKIDVKFLYYWMDFNKSYLTKMAVGSTVKSLRMYMLEKFPLLMAPQLAQQKVVTILTSLDDAIEKTDQIFTKTKMLKNGLMNELFTKGIDHKKFKKTRIGNIPDEWDVKRISEVAKVTTGITPLRSKKQYYSGNIPWVKSNQVNFNQIDASDETVSVEAVKECRMKIIKPGAVLIAMYGQGITRGRCAVLGVEATTNQAIASLEVNNDIDNLFLYYYLQSNYEYLRSLGHGGNQRNLNTQIIGSIEIPIPQKSEQERIVEILVGLDVKVNQEQSQKEKLVLLKKGLMQDIFTQKIEIN